MSLHRALPLALSALILVLAVPSGAAASTTVGYPLSTAAPDSWQPGTLIAQRRNDDPSGTSYGGFAVGGVLTSVSVRTSGAAADMRVLVLRRTADPSPATATFLSTAEFTVPVTADADFEGHVTTLPTRVNVSPGDRFAVTTAASGTWYLHYLAAAQTDYCFFNGTPHPVGSSATYNSASCNNYMPLVVGTVEPDADQDGYGDETQDLCPSDATRQTACPLALLPANVTITAVRSSARSASTASRSFIIRNTGQVAATLVPVRVRSSKKVRNLRIVNGCNPSPSRTTCTLANLDPGATVTIKVGLAVRTATRTTLTATAGAATASSTVKFKPQKK